MNKDFGAIIKKLFKKREGGSARKPLIGTDARDDWKKLVIFFLAINVLILGWSAYIFFQITQGNLFEVAPAPGAGAEVSTQTNLKSTLNIYDGREKQFEALRQAEPRTTDPAI